MANKLSEIMQSLAQGASNGIAGGITAPVDGLSWLMRKAGVNMPDAPVGGSNWANQLGLTPQPQNRLAGLIGEGIGGALPSVIAGKAPQIAGGLLKMGENAMAPSALSKQAGVIRISQKPGSTWLAAESENGLVGGHVRDGSLYISHSNLEEAARGKGEGIKLYQSLVDDALAKGFNVFSDSTVESPAVRMYEALGRRGYNVSRMAGGVLEDGSVYGAGASAPAFKISK